MKKVSKLSVPAPKKAKPALEIKSEPQPAAPQIAQDLLEKKQALRALVTTHSLLNEGAFPKAAFQAVVDCQDFLTNCHKNLRQDVLSHPDFDKDPELKPLKESKNGQIQSI